MKLSTLVLAGLVLTASSAYADLSAKFGGGCRAANTKGSCTLKVTGTDPDGSGTVVDLQKATKGSKHFRVTSPHYKTLDSNGEASFRFRNQAACYRVGIPGSQTHSNSVCE